MGDFQSLRVWRVAHGLALAVYQETKRFPTSELYGLTSQLRRASTSIPANLAEGCGRDTDGELARFCRIALGSANELEYHLILARDLQLLTAEAFACLAADTRRVKRMLARLLESLRTDSRQPTTDSLR